MPLRTPPSRPLAASLTRAARGAVAGTLAAVALAACADGAPTAPGDAGLVPTARASVAAVPGAPVCHVVDFEGFVRGDYVASVTAGPLNLAISTTAFRANTSSVVGRARIFDTDHVSASANEGTDMEWDGPFARCASCQGLGNMLMVQRVSTTSVLDNNPGGIQTLTGFPAGEYWVQSFTVLDNDRDELGFRLLVDGALVAQSTPLGDGTVEVVQTGSQVLIDGQVQFILGTEAVDAALGSGGIDDLTFCTNPAPPPGLGCTRTIGYWKNHEEVLASYLPQTLGGTVVSSVSVADAIISTGGSNGIDKLRAQMLAAKLNVAKGASGATIAEALAAADAFLSTHAPADWRTLSKAEQQQVLAWKDVFDAYNNGRLGPPHCS